MTERMITLANGHHIWTRTVSGGAGLPLLILHGGPGAGHDYVEPYEALARDRPVIFYDQLGCGRSDKPDNRALWTIERFADEVDEVRTALGMTRCHLLGQSWGGMLAVEYLLRQPAGLQSAVLASAAASIPEIAENLPPFIALMSADDQATLHLHTKNRTFDHPEFQAAALRFYQRFLCHLDPWPDCLMRTVANGTGNAVAEAMQGPSEFEYLGNLRYWNRIPDLGRIAVPTLITCGRHDFLGPSSATLAKGIAGSRSVIFENSSHCPHLEEPEAHFACVADFLADAERA